MIWFRAAIDSNDFGIVVEHYGGDAPDWIQLMVWGAGSIQYYTENGSIGNPSESANPGMLAVGAAPWNDVRAIEPYSSRGPTSDGRVKPDIVGADCGATALLSGGFCGTSQASPHVVGGAATVTVSSRDPLVARHDANDNGMIDKAEVIKAIDDYLFGDGPDAPTKAKVIQIIDLYLFGPTPAPPEACAVSTHGTDSHRQRGGRHRLPDRGVDGRLPERPGGRHRLRGHGVQCCPVLQQPVTLIWSSSRQEWAVPWLTRPAVPSSSRPVRRRWTVVCGSSRMRANSAESTKGNRARASSGFRSDRTMFPA